MKKERTSISLPMNAQLRPVDVLIYSNYIYNVYYTNAILETETSY